MKNLKSRRGFSLVELMVVVAIMGTLAAIAIPAYNEYRKSAKKTAYKSDLLSLHKGWLAFGVELDSFCERETSPDKASIQNVGMSSLLSSNLYGSVGMCSDTSMTTQATCIGQWDDDNDPLTPNINRVWSPSNTLNKQNFIGFGAVSCTTNPVIPLGNVRRHDGNSNDAQCTLDVTEYRAGVFGHISGKDYVAYDVRQTGVINETTQNGGVNLVKTDVDETCS